MTSQMSEMQREVDDKLKIEAALKNAEQARKEVHVQSLHQILCPLLVHGCAVRQCQHSNACTAHTTKHCQSCLCLLYLNL